MKKYLVRVWMDDIKEVECVRETPQYVFILVEADRWNKEHERRSAKITDREGYFDSHAEAVTWKEDLLWRKLVAVYETHKQAEKN